MDKFIQPRGTGRTYNICKYAIEHDCDIVSPTIRSRQYCLDTIKKICDESNGEYVLCKTNKDSRDLEAIVFRSEEEALIKITLYTAWVWQATQGNARSVVVDDIDECFKKVMGVNIKACSMKSYNPADVALKGRHNND